MTSTPFRLIDLETEPLEPVEFPNGHVYEVRPLGVEEHRLFEELAVHHDVPRALGGRRSSRTWGRCSSRWATRLSSTAP